MTTSPRADGGGTRTSDCFSLVTGNSQTTSTVHGVCRLVGAWLLCLVLSTSVCAQNVDIVFTAESASGSVENDRLPNFRIKGWICGRDFRGGSAERLQEIDEALAAFGRLTPVLEILVQQADAEVGIEPNAIGNIALRVLDGGPFEALSSEPNAERRLLQRSKRLADDVFEAEEARRTLIRRVDQLRAVRPTRESLSLTLGSSVHVLNGCFSVEDLETMLNAEKRRAEDLLEERDRYLQLRQRLLTAGKG